MRKKHNLLHYIITIFFILIKSLVSAVVWILVGFSGYLIFQTKKTPYDIVVGMPLMLIGGGLIINKLGDVANSIFSPTYNRGVCILCGESDFRNHNKFKEILGIK